MARITRFLQKVFAESAANNGQFGSCQLGTKVITSNPTTIQALSAWASGWLSATIDAKRLPPLEEMQGLQYVQTLQLAYILQEGVAEWEVGTTYYENSWVKAPGTNNLYSSITDSNIGNLPTDATKWLFLGNLSQMVTSAETSTVDGQLMVASGTGGRTLKKSAITGLLKQAANVVAAAVQGVDYYAPGGTKVAISDGGTGQGTALDAFNALKQNATDSYAGVSEYATNTEAQTATATDRTVTPANLGATITGINQTWQDVIASRVQGTSYQNTTGRPIMVNILASGNNSFIQASANNSVWVNVGRSGSDRISGAFFIVPPGWYYRLAGSPGNDLVVVWSELR